MSQNAQQRERAHPSQMPAQHQQEPGLERDLQLKPQWRAPSYKAAGKGDGRELAFADFCQVLMCLNEFVYVD